ncbi:MAG TPA: peptidylprolyl isomerase [Candidatus Paceibacterota bacterium]
MEENKVPKSAYITLIIAVIVLAAGYYLWSMYQSDSDQIIPIENTNTAVTEVNKDISAVSQRASAITPEINQTSKNNMHIITIETNKGVIVFQTYDKDAPKAVKNFIDLANKGFYDGVIFHRVIKGFMIQGGDPTGTGRGGPGYTFEDELDPATESYKFGYKRGIVAMANAGPNTNGSQFFIMHADYPLPNSYTIFGRVISGMDVVDNIANSKTGDADKPLEDIVMNKISVELTPVGK